MKRRNLFSTIIIPAVTGMMMLMIAGNAAYAIGTPAGTTITTVAKVDYKAASTSDTRSISSDPVVITVAYKVAIDITSALAASATTDGTTIEIPFTVTNQGNATDDFALSVTGGTRPTGGTLGWSVAFVKASDGSAASTVNLASGSSISLKARVTIPFDVDNTTTVDGTSYTILVKATSQMNDADVPYNIVNEHGASDAFTATVPISKPLISVNVTSTPADPSSMKPGDALTYSIVVNNTGSAAATSLNVDWAYVSSLFSSVTPAADAGLAKFSIASIAAGGSSTLTFTTTISPTLAAGTYTVGDAASKVVYSDGNGSRTWTYDAPKSFTVITVKGFSIAVDPATTDYTVEPGASKSYTLKVKNWGNVADGFTIANADGTGDNLTGATYSFDENDVATVEPGAVKDIVFTVTAPEGAIDKKVSVQTITVTRKSTGGATPVGSPSPVLSNLTTTVSGALLSITLVGTNLDDGAKLANPDPGQRIQYEVTITNNGSRPALSVSSQNTSPFPVGDIQMGKVDIDADGNGTYEITDQADGATFGAGGAGSVVNSSGTVKVTFPPIPKDGIVRYKYVITLTK
ncbi:MAG: CARDB domain-containing protein [Acidobacteriota bacterium]